MKDITREGIVQISHGMDNFAYIKSRNGKRTNVVDLLKKFEGKKVEIKIREDTTKRWRI